MSAKLDNKVKFLEEIVMELQKRPVPQDLEPRVKKLEGELMALKARMGKRDG